VPFRGLPSSENLWDRSDSTLTQHNANDDIDLGSGALDTSGIGTFGSVAIPTVFTDITGPSGFVDKTAVLSWNNGTYTFTITGDHDIYINGVKTTKGTVSKQIADTTGLHWIYYDADGVIQETTGDPDFNLPTIATVYWNTVTNKGLLGEERHGIKMSGDTHTLLHYTVGTRYQEGLTGAFLDDTFTITEGIIADEDLPHIIAEQTTCDVLYKNGAADFQWDLAQTTYYKEDTGTLQYNNVNALASVTNNYYMAMWVFATNDTTTPITALMGQREDKKLVDARVNNKYESLTLGTLPFEEMKLLYRVILQNLGGTTTYTETQDLRSVSNLPAGTYVATQHNALTGLNWSVAGHTWDEAVDFNAQNLSNIGTLNAGAITGTSLTLTAPSRVRAYKSAADQSVATGTWTKITLDVEDYDTLGEFTNSTFTATQAGYYLINGNMRISGLPNERWAIIGIYKNGAVTAINRITSAVETQYALSVSNQLYLDIGDTIELWLSLIHI